MSGGWTGSQFEIEFTKSGGVADEGQATTVKEAIRISKPTDVLIVSHGWNNNLTDARGLYDALTEVIDLEATQPAFGGPLTGRSCTTIRVLWPSKKFDEDEEIAGGGLSVDRSPARLRAQLTNLANTVSNDTAKSLLRAADGVSVLQHAEARESLVSVLQAAVSAELVDDDDENSPVARAFLLARAEDIFSAFDAPVLMGDPDTLPNAGGAVGGVGSDVVGAAERIVNFTTYWMMKRRAGKVGAKGLNPLIQELRNINRDIKVHLVGHSFGGRLVTAAVRGKTDGTPAKVQTLSLLQAAFSHNGFAPAGNGNVVGYFRSIIDQKSVAGPIVITHTQNDRAVGLAYALASRLSGDNANALGGPDDEYGGIGANGSVRTPEAVAGAMLPGSHRTPLSAGKINNLRADDFIKSHSDIRSRPVAAAILSAIAN